MTEKFESVYAMLGYPDPESMQLKARLADEIAKIVKMKGLTQAQAAERIGMPQPKLSNLLRGQFRGVSEAKMMECITRLGSDVQIFVKAAPVSRPAYVALMPKRQRAKRKTATKSAVA